MKAHVCPSDDEPESDTPTTPDENKAKKAGAKQRERRGFWNSRARTRVAASTTSAGVCPTSTRVRYEKRCARHQCPRGSGESVGDRKVHETAVSRRVVNTHGIWITGNDLLDLEQN